MVFWLEVLCVLGLTGVTCALESPGVEWPQWRGLNRDGVSWETGLLKKWPAGGPALIWETKGVGKGFSSVSIKGGKVFTQGDRGEKSFVVALDYESGKELWSFETGAAFKGNYGDDGPRGTPTLDGKFLYVLSAHGVLCSLEAETGVKRWSLDIIGKFRGECPEWKFSESPMVVGDKLICTPGGPDATIVALDKLTGETLWTSKGLSDPAAYSSPILVEAAGIRQVVNFTAKGVVGVALDDGRFLWRYDRTANGIANVATPVVKGSEIFTTTFYEAACALIRLKPDGEGKVKVEEVYMSRELQNHHGGVVLVADQVYGFHKGSALKCIEWSTGTARWANRSVGKGSLVYADGCLYVVGEDGDVALVEATQIAYRELSRFSLPEHGTQSAWAHPVVCGGRLFIRTEDKLRCYNVSAGNVSAGDGSPAAGAAGRGS